MEKLNGVRAIERALAILDCFSEQANELGVTDIAKMVGLAKSTTSRIMATLEQAHYLIQNPNGKFRIGPKGLQLGKMFLHNLDYRHIARPYMREIGEQTGETVSIYIKSNGKRICIERIESNQVLRPVITIGEQMSLARGASGKLLTAFAGSEEEQAALDQSELARILAEGYAISHGEREEGASSVAAPIFDHNGRTIAALTLSGPTFRFQEERLQTYIGIMRQYARKISAELGY